VIQIGLLSVVKSETVKGKIRTIFLEQCIYRAFIRYEEIIHELLTKRFASAANQRRPPGGGVGRRAWVQAAVCSTIKFNKESRRRMTEE
jgi:hypothetical protein